MRIAEAAESQLEFGLSVLHPLRTSSGRIFSRLVVNHGLDDREVVTHTTLEGIHVYAFIVAVNSRNIRFRRNDRVEAVANDAQVPGEMAVGETGIDRCWTSPSLVGNSKLSIRQGTCGTAPRRRCCTSSSSGIARSWSRRAKRPADRYRSTCRRSSRRT
jgi:hypothetical protein